MEHPESIPIQMTRTNRKSEVFFVTSKKLADLPEVQPSLPSPRPVDVGTAQTASEWRWHCRFRRSTARALGGAATFRQTTTENDKIESSKCPMITETVRSLAIERPSGLSIHPD